MNNGQRILEEVKGYAPDKELFEKQIKFATLYCEKENMIYRVNYMEHLKKNYGKN